MTGNPERPVTAAARESAIDLLSEHFAQDNLSLDDFERRVTKAHAATDMETLERLLKDLPVGNVPAPRASQPPGGGTLPARRVPAAVSSGRVRDHDRALAIFSETKRLGRWIPARENQVIAVFGSSVLDLREALLGPGETVFQCYSVLGSIEVIAPEGMYVECTGSALLGSFEQHQNSPVSIHPDAPVVRIEGLSILGSVEVEFREPGESKREAKKRRRREKREQRRLGAG